MPSIGLVTHEIRIENLRFLWKQKAFCMIKTNVLQNYGISFPFRSGTVNVKQKIEGMCLVYQSLVRDEIFCLRQKINLFQEWRVIFLTACPVAYHISGLFRLFPSCTGQISHMQHDIRVVNASERKQRQDMERIELEKRELLEILKSLRDEMELSKSNCKKKEPRITAL